jgi:hypothetical protein
MARLTNESFGFKLRAVFGQLLFGAASKFDVTFGTSDMPKTSELVCFRDTDIDGAAAATRDACNRP